MCHVFVLASVLIAAAQSDSTAPSVAEERASFRLADPALMIEPVASEPQVQSPVAIAWDADGAMYVAEMSDYPNADTGGRIKRLVDRDGDGVYEQATVFADALPFPNGVVPHEGGILVTAAPHLWFFKDNDGDGKADERRIVLTGFGEGNQQLRANSPTWGLDNLLYLANGRSGGRVRGENQPEDSGIAIDRNDLRVSPTNWKPEPVAGFSQFGLPHDDLGNRFPSWNTVPFRHVVIELSDATTRENRAMIDEFVADVIAPGDTRVYPIAPAPRTFNGESFAYFNATCGSTIFRGDALGEAYRGNAFVCESLTSLVHRRRLAPAGPTFLAQRVEKDAEFLASTHPWFKPVNLATGPDGALYVVDFCRALVEHPAFVQEPKRAGVDFRKGHEFGRIWRVRPAESDPRSTALPRVLTPLGQDELVSLLNHTNAWQRDTAQRLLVERGAREAIPALKGLVKSAPWAVSRVQALWTIAGIGMRLHEKVFEPEFLGELLRDPDPRLREHALRLFAYPDLALRTEPHSADILALTLDSDPRVRLRAIIASATIDDAERFPAIVQSVLAHPPETWQRHAIEIAVGPNLERFLLEMKQARPDWFQETSPVNLELIHSLAAARGRGFAGSEGNADLLGLACEPGALAEHDRAFRIAIMSGLLDGIATAGLLAQAISDTAPDQMANLVREAVAIARSTEATDELRAAALRLAVAFRAPQAYELVSQLIRKDQPELLQRAAVQGAIALDNESLAGRLWQEKASMTQASRRQLMSGALQAKALARTLLEGIAQEAVDPNEVEPSVRAALNDARDPAIRDLATRLLPPRSHSARADVLKRYEVALSLDADPLRGEQLFAQNCHKCHERNGKGHRVGPDLTSVAGRPKEDILTSMLDPNREVAPDQTSYVVLLRDGRLLDGLLAGETAASIKLKRAEGVEETLPRDQIEELRVTGRSLMPEGLEETLSVQDVADLIACLRQPATSR